MKEYKGCIGANALDMPNQVEYNRRKNVEQDQRLSVMGEQIQEILNQSPSGFLPRVYYGLTRGDQTYRFEMGFVFSIEDLEITGEVGDAFELTSSSEPGDYISAVAIKINDSQARIIIPGDYTVNVNTFTLLNQRTGEMVSVSLSSPLSLQEASYLGSYSASDNKNKQITVLNDLEVNKNNVVFASVDYNADDRYNWVRVGSFIDGIDGHSIFAFMESNIDNIETLCRAEDLFIYFGPNAITYKTYLLEPYDFFEIDSMSPFEINKRGNIKGAKGDTGSEGPKGDTGENGITPHIQDNEWYIGEEATGVIALGQDGQDGADGQAFAMQTGLFSTPDNFGEPGNVGPNGETLQELPELPSVSITGKGYSVYDPLTTPLDPYFDLYYANNGDEEWTILHPFSGVKGANGNDGHTPYIQGGYWYINGSSTGVQAVGPEGPEGPQGEKGLNPMGTWIADNEHFVDDIVTYNGSSYICIMNHSGISITPDLDTARWLKWVSKGDTGAQGPQGTAGVTPNIVANATQLAPGLQPTVTKSGTLTDPVFTFGIPQGQAGPGVAAGGTTGQILAKSSGTDYATTWKTLGSSDITSALGYTPYNATNPNNYINANNASILDKAKKDGSNITNADTWKNAIIPHAIEFVGYYSNNGVLDISGIDLNTYDYIIYSVIVTSDAQDHMLGFTNSSTWITYDHNATSYSRTGAYLGWEKYDSATTYIHKTTSGCEAIITTSINGGGVYATCSSVGNAFRLTAANNLQSARCALYRIKR